MEWIEAFQKQDPRAFAPTLSEGELKQYEAQNGIELPEQYRLFLLHIGDGTLSQDPDDPGCIRPLVRDIRPEHSACYAPNLPFPWIRSWTAYGNIAGRAAARVSRCIDPDLGVRLEDVHRSQGCILLSTDGPGGYLLVINGKMRGTVWRECLDPFTSMEAVAGSFFQFLSPTIGDNTAVDLVSCAAEIVSSEEAEREGNGTVE